MTEAVTTTSRAKPPLSAPARRAVIVLGVVATLLLATSAALALVVKSHVDDRDAVIAARNAALAAARQEIVNLDTIDWRTFDRDVKRVLDGATGNFKEQFTRASKDLRPKFVQTKTTVSGAIAAAGIVRSDLNSATVLLAADITVREGTSAPRLGHDRWMAELEKHHGRWLVARLDGVA
jgi:Mce-associated membrane protein